MLIFAALTQPNEHMNQSAILSTAYLGPVQYFQKLALYPQVRIEQQEHMIKQTYRSRCDIYSPNGILTLSIPLEKRGRRQAVKEARICYDYDWQTLHWRSLESGYRRSPFFEYYEDDLRPYYDGRKEKYLVDFNEALQQEILQLLKLESAYSYTTSYEPVYPATDDFRNLISPKSTPGADPGFSAKPYSQVFGQRHGFISNLSIVDLLFNQGSKAQEYL